MSVQDPTTLHNPDTLQQPEGINTSAVVGIVVVSTIVSIVGGFIAWFLLLFFYGEVRPNMDVSNYPERTIGRPGQVKDLAIEQVFFEEPVQPGEEDRSIQIEKLDSVGKSAVDANAAHIPIEDAMKLYTKQQEGKK